MKDEIIVRLEAILVGLESVIKEEGIHDDAKKLAVEVRKDIKPIIFKLENQKNEK
jgi:hypothetical protein